MTLLAFLQKALDWVSDHVPCLYTKDCSICPECKRCRYHGRPCVGEKVQADNNSQQVDHIGP